MALTTAIALSSHYIRTYVIFDAVVVDTLVMSSTTQPEKIEDRNATKERTRKFGITEPYM